MTKEAIRKLRKYLELSEDEYPSSSSATVSAIPEPESRAGDLPDTEDDLVVWLL